MLAARYSEIYGVSIVNISRWKSAGVRNGLPCPLDYPERMPEWWQKMMDVGEYTKGVPAKILAAAARASVGLAKLDEEPGGDPSAPSDIPPAEPGKPIDYAASLALAERNVGVVRDMFHRAQAAGNDQLIVSMQRTLNDALDSHRSLMRDRGKIQAEAGETLPKSEVRAALLEIHGNICKRFRQGLKSAHGDIADHAESRETWGLFIDALVDKICTGMNSTDFAAPPEL